MSGEETWKPGVRPLSRADCDLCLEQCGAGLMEGERELGAERAGVTERAEGLGGEGGTGFPGSRGSGDMNRSGSCSAFSRPHRVSLWQEGALERMVTQPSLG